MLDSQELSIEDIIVDSLTTSVWAFVKFAQSKHAKTLQSLSAAKYCFGNMC